jgi:NADH-ubiquinone oxidoreductase chain 5
MALLEVDMKKVVALSTLSQIGLSFLILGLGLNFFCLFHLLRHALFKCCLFVQVGFLILFCFGQQDGRFFFNIFY